MGEIEQPAPLLAAEDLLGGGYGAFRLDRSITREHAALQEVVGGLVDHKLEVAVDASVGDALSEAFRDGGDIAHLDDAFDLPARRESQSDRMDHTEQAVAADDEAEKFGVLAATARE